MATLIVDFHCMCLFVPDGDRVHVLLPAMHGDGGETGDVICRAEDATATSHRHLARVRNPKFPDRKLGKPIDNLILKLGNGTGANTDLNGNPERQPRLPNLTEVSNEFVPQALVTGPLAEDLTARFTLGSGAVLSRHSDPHSWNWAGNTDIQLANTVTWIVPDSPDALDWEWGANNERPIQSLSRDLTPLTEDVYRISIHHETKQTLCGGEIDIAAMQHHFAQFYRLLGMQPPTPAECPRLFPEYAGKRKDRERGASVLCRAAMAQLA